ncbi:hypothetical protein BDA99DRAFT_602704 [Phascolomyces articulosus]|uniref:RhoGAP-domain-containing protein n=1 Tax=Phascolomyces articulosus TaxID=60185 RepID=A0AAD5KKX9_9FUNG|nr:hypothetical protein BDA99DRAFT_602704 [Phascolomyces articulosus]
MTRQQEVAVYGNNVSAPPTKTTTTTTTSQHIQVQGDQLWKIIEKQRVMIQNLQKDNAILAAERDGLRDRISHLEHKLVHSNKEFLQQQQQQQQAVLISAEKTKEILENDQTQPTLPPRSPYRHIIPPSHPQHPTVNTSILMDEHHHYAHHQGRTSPPLPPPAILDRRPSTPASPPPSTPPPPQTPTSPQAIIEKDAHLYAQYQSSIQKKEQQKQHQRPSQQQQKQQSVQQQPIPQQAQHQQQQQQPPRGYYGVPSASKSSSVLDVHRKAAARQQQQGQEPMPRHTTEYDPSMRPTSPTIMLRTPKTSSFSDGALVIPTNSSRANKRESMIIGDPLGLDEETEDDMDEDEPVKQQQQQPVYQYPPPQDEEKATLTAKNINSVMVKVIGSNITTNDRGRELVSFVISVGKRGTEYEELWRVQKLYSDFIALDTKIKAQGHVRSKVGKLPDKQLFSTSSRAPSKIDQRKVALEQYLQHIISLPYTNISDVCEFLTTNVIERDNYHRTGRKAGYLTKRGKNFGGWKTRYFKIKGAALEYYESKDGSYLGAIKLTNAQLGRQAPGNEETGVYRHAFLILEQKRSGPSGVVKHILCANSDEERDEWVEALFNNIRFDHNNVSKKINNNSNNSSNNNNSNNNNNSISSSNSNSSSNKKMEKQRKVSKGEIRPVAAAPIKNIKNGDHPHQGADMDKLTSAPSIPIPPPSSSSNGMDDPSNTTIGGVGLTPSASTDSSAGSSTAFLSTSMPSIHATPVFNGSNTPSSPPPPPPHTTPPRRSSASGNDEEDPSRLRANMVSPGPGSHRSSEDMLSSSYEGPSNDRKVKQKANRVTMWGKKMFSSNNNNNDNNLSSTTVYNNNHGNLSGTTLSAENNTPPRVSNGPSGFRGLLSRSSNDSSERHSEDTDKNHSKRVFGVPLEDAVRVARVSDNYELPAIVYRCIEYLDAKNAVMEEGLYRLSGSNMVMQRLKQKFNQEGDINLLAAKEEYDVHAIAGLLKMWLRELPTTVLTREHRNDFMHVIDFLDRKDRVNELGRLVSLLPLANYTLLRALTAHLIRVIRHSDVNKMTMRNVSIVFSPTLGVPATIFNLFMSEFEYIFWTTEDGDAAPRMLEDDTDDEEEDTIEEYAKETATTTTAIVIEQRQQHQMQQTPPPIRIERKATLRLREEFGRSNRNSVHYMDGAPNAIVSMEKGMNGAAVFDEDDEDVDDLELLKGQESTVVSDDEDEDQESAQHMFKGLSPMPPKSSNATTTGSQQQ